jgi:hypothetical protein
VPPAKLAMAQVKAINNQKAALRSELMALRHYTAAVTERDPDKK